MVVGCHCGADDGTKVTRRFRHARRPNRGRRWLVVTCVLLAAGGGLLFALGLRTPGGPSPTGMGLPVGSTPGQQVLPASSAPKPTAAPTTSAPPVLSLPGRVPTSGTGTWTYDTTSSPVRGRAGTLLHYRVAVEKGANEQVHPFAEFVDVALSDSRSWIGSGDLRLQRVPVGTSADFTVYLATRNTAGRMCLAGGTDITIDGVPYTSCRAGDQVIINLDRWRLSVPHFISAGIPLQLYRLYVVNHEVGHRLGHGHEKCPAPGRPAPTMQQQTLVLKGCTANPWPYLNGRRYQGPAGSYG